MRKFIVVALFACVGCSSTGTAATRPDPPQHSDASTATTISASDGMAVPGPIGTR